MRPQFVARSTFFFRRSQPVKLDWINQSSLPEAFARYENKAARARSVVPEGSRLNSASAFLRPEEAALCPRIDDDEWTRFANCSGGAGDAHGGGCHYQLVQRISSLLSREQVPSTLPSSARDRAHERAFVGQDATVAPPPATTASKVEQLVRNSTGLTSRVYIQHVCVVMLVALMAIAERDLSARSTSHTADAKVLGPRIGD